jgi:hypothetical protein
MRRPRSDAQVCAARNDGAVGEAEAIPRDDFARHAHYPG